MTMACFLKRSSMLVAAATLAWTATTTCAGGRGLFGKSRNGSISAHGRVLDQDGRLLDGVTVSVIRVTGIAFGKSKHTRESITVQGGFEFVEKGISDLRLTFSKDGYYELSRSYHADTSIENETVVLEAVGDIADMVSASPTFFLRPDFSGAVVNLGGSRPESHKVSDMRDGSEDLPEHSMVLAADIQNGGFVRVMFPVPWNKDGVRSVGGLTLRMTAPEDGIVLAETPEGESRSWVVLRGMKEAPEGGYRREIRIPARERSYFFYFRTGGRYGKGVINSPRGTLATQIRKSVSLFIQTGTIGSRNVNMTHY